MPASDPPGSNRSTAYEGPDSPRPQAAETLVLHNPASAEHWRTVQRIARSPAFHKSPRVRNLLLFIADRSIAGRNDELTELEIGHKVLDRGSDYVPADDSIVRSSIRQLRLKLLEFYESEGLAEPWIVEIPKGSYLATFRRRGEDASYDSARQSAPPTAPGSLRRLTPWGIACAALTILLIASVAANVFLLLRPDSPAGRRGSPPSLLGALVANNPHRTQVVVDDFAWVLMQSMSHYGHNLEDYASRAYVPLDRAPSRDPLVLRLWNLLGTRYIVSLGALGSVDRIFRSVPDLSKVYLRHARNMTARDFQDGSLILYGQPPNNPWTQLFEEKLNFRRNREGEAVFINSRPRPGELARYAAPQPASINSGAGYARIALLPNLSGKDFVLILSGLNMVTSEAAAEYATNPRYLPGILKLLGARSVAELPPMELLLETSSFDSAPKDMRIIAWRRVNPIQ